MMRFPIMKKRAVTDPAPAGQSPSDAPTPDLNKKRSKMELIKNKLSFKDLRKESLRPEISPPIPIMVPDIPSMPLTAHTKLHPRPLPRGHIPSISSATTTEDLPAKLRPVDFSQTSSILLSSGINPQVNIPSSKIPLAPSHTLSHAQGTMAPMRSASLRTGGSVNRNASVSKKADEEKPVMDNDAAMSASTGKSEPNIMITRPIPGTSIERQEQITSPTSTLNYPVTEDSPAKSLDLLEGSNEVKCLQHDWAIEEGDTPSPTPLPKNRDATVYMEGEASIKSLPGSVSSFQERLLKADIELHKPAPKETQDLDITMYLDNIVDMILSTKRETEAEMEAANQKIDELAAWIRVQLKNVVDSVSDWARANSELFANHHQMSRDMMKLQMDLRTEIGILERRLNIFEMNGQDAWQAEVRALAQAHDELTFNYEVLYERLLSHPMETQELLEKMVSQQGKVEVAIEETKNKVDKVPQDIRALEHRITMLEASIGSKDALKTAGSGGANVDLSSKVSTPVSVMTVRPIASKERIDESTTRNIETTVTQPSTSAPQSQAGPISPVPAASSTLTQPRTRARSQTKSPRIPRSLSLPKKAFLKNVKDAASTTPEKGPEKAKTPEASTTPEDGKKRNVFSFRRRRQVSDSAGSGSNKLTWTGARRPSTTNDGTNSRSSTPPVPAIPRLIPQWITTTNTLSISHPAHRTTPQTNTGNDETPSTQQSPTATATVTVQSQVVRDDDFRASKATSTKSSVGENKAASSGVISTGTFHSAEDKHAESTANNAVDDNAQAPLLGDTDQDWDRVSLRESHSRETLV